MLNSDQEGAAIGRTLRAYVSAPVEGPDAEMWVASAVHNVLVSTHGRIFCPTRRKLLHLAKGPYPRIRVYALSAPPTLVADYAHRVIAAAFHGPCPRPMVVIFKDNDHTNLSPFNLAYAQRSSVAYSSMTKKG